MYEGHIWYEEAGIGMKRLITSTRNEIHHYPVPKIGDIVLYKAVVVGEDAKILNYHVLTNSGKQDLSIIAAVLKNVIATDDSSE